MTVSSFVTTLFNQEKTATRLQSIIPICTIQQTQMMIMYSDNPRKNILYESRKFCSDKDSLGLNFGFALTFNIPLDNRFQDSCLMQLNTQINLQKQELNAKLLNYEIARLKNCGELMLKAVIYFEKK